jgi:hypothetical protein
MKLLAQEVRKFKKKLKRAKNEQNCAVHRSTMVSIVLGLERLVGQGNDRRKSEENLSSQYDSTHRSTMRLLGDQGDQTHMISYNFELNLSIAVRWV